MKKGLYIWHQQTNTFKMTTLRCIREVKTKSGLTFNKGEFYSYVIISQGIRVWIDSDQSIVIKNEKTLNKYFK